MTKQEIIWDYYQTQHRESFAGSYGRLKFLVKQCKNKKVLNIGVGGGIFEELALKNNIDIYSLDPSKNSIDIIKKIIGEDKAKVGYSQNIPFEDEYFDVVVMSEVLEHLDNNIIEKTLHEVRRVLKSNGKFIGTVPYNENLEEQMIICPNCGKKFHRWGHVQSFNEQKLYDLLLRFFYRVKIKKKMFISWNTLNWKGKVSTVITYLFFLINIKKNGLNLFFEACKK